MSSAAAAMMKSPVSGSLGALMRETQPSELLGIGDYEFGHVIGEGQFGTVRKARHLTSNQTVAVKIISKRKLVPQTIKMIQREVAIMKMLRHPNIIRLYEVIDTDEFLFLIMEHAPGGEMMDIILSHGRLKEAEARKYFAQAAYALAYCHSHHTVHRDVKAENMLLDDNMNIKLIDFGFSNIYDPTNVLQTFCGSPTYASPELVQRHAYTGPEVDCWSLGVLLYVLVSGELPFTGDTYLELYQKIVSASYKMPSYLTPACKDLILNMLQPDPENRLNIIQICNHPWVLAGHLTVPAENFSTMQTALKEEDLNKKVLDYMESLGFDRETVVRSVVEAKYDDAAATYYLMLEASPRQRTFKPDAGRSSSGSFSPSNAKISPEGTSEASEVSSISGESNPEGDKKYSKDGKSKTESGDKKGNKERKYSKAEKRRSNSVKLGLLRDPVDEISGVEQPPIITTEVKDEPVSPKSRKSSRKVPPKLLTVKRLQDGTHKVPVSPPSPSDATSPRNLTPQSRNSFDATSDSKRKADSSAQSRVTPACSSESGSSRMSSLTGDEHEGNTKVGTPKQSPHKTSSRSPSRKKYVRTPYARENSISARLRGDDVKGTRSTPASPVSSPMALEHTVPPLVEMEIKGCDDDDDDMSKSSSKKRKHHHHHHHHHRHCRTEQKDLTTADKTSPEQGKLMSKERDDVDDSDMTGRDKVPDPTRKRSSTIDLSHGQETVGARSKECLGLANTAGSLYDRDKADDERRESVDMDAYSSLSETELSSAEISPVTEQSMGLYSSTDECTSEPRTPQNKRNGESPLVLLTPKTPKTPKSPLSNSRDASPVSSSRIRYQNHTHSVSNGREAKAPNVQRLKKNKTVVIPSRDPSESKTTSSRSQSPADPETPPETPEIKESKEQKETKESKPPKPGKESRRKIISRTTSYSAATHESKMKRQAKTEKLPKEHRVLGITGGEIQESQSKEKSDRKRKTDGLTAAEGKESEESESKETEEEDESDVGSPRSVRFAISLKTVCELEPGEIMKRIEEGLKTLGPSISSKKETPSMYRVLCRERRVVLEVEVCRLLFLPVHGIKFHRVSGDAWKYSSLCKEITAAVNLE